VHKIHPIIDSRLRTFQVDARFVNPPSVLYPNLTAEANIIISQKKRAILIPRDYLVNGSYVLTKKNKKLKVRTGLKDYEMVEITSDLDTSQYIYKPK
jgi:multidrug efflux pump subunit AcrA (membrane-fusion protein)